MAGWRAAAAAAATAACRARARGLNYPPSVLHETRMPLRQAHDVRAHGARRGEVLRPEGVARQGGHGRLQRHHGRVEGRLALSLLANLRGRKAVREEQLLEPSRYHRLTSA